MYNADQHGRDNQRLADVNAQLVINAVLNDRDSEQTFRRFYRDNGVGGQDTSCRVAV